MTAIQQVHIHVQLVGVKWRSGVERATVSTTVSTAITEFMPTNIKGGRDMVTLIPIGYGYNKKYRGYYSRFKVLIKGEPIERKFSKEELKRLNFWVPSSRVLAVTVWGSNQTWEAKVAIGDFLGWNNEANSDEKTFLHRLTEEVTVSAPK